MKTRRRTYTAETPALLFSEALAGKPNVQALPAQNSINAKGNRVSKKKCITGLWNMNIPSELLQEILSRLGLKANIQASAVCKTWCEAAVSVRKIQPRGPRPWLFYPLRRLEDGNYILFDPSRSHPYKLNFPKLKGYRFSYSKDGWLLVITYAPSYSVFLFNPFTREHISLPKVSPTSGYCLAFSAAPTSSSCLVISLNYTSIPSCLVIDTWRPGETLWTTHRFENQPSRRWNNCVFSNGMFCCLSTCGYLGVFDPLGATWNILPVKPCLAFRQVDFTRRMLMTEHEGDIFVMFTTRNNKPSSVFKLNRKRKVWEEKRELGGLTVFASQPTSLTRAGLSVEERNRFYPSRNGHLGVYFTIGGEKVSCPLPSSNYMSNRIAWVDPPHNNVNF